MNQPSKQSPSLEKTVGAWFQKSGLTGYVLNNSEIRVQGFTDDSREVKPGWAFIAVKGPDTDGHQYLQQAVDKGATCLIVENAEKCPDGVATVALTDTRRALAELAQAWWGRPAEKLDAVGITGTNGKTTTAYLTEALLRGAGRRPALLSTVTYRFGDLEEPAANTTPGAVKLARLMDRFYQQGADSLVMEVSSHALDQGRAQGLRFAAALMTNLSQDHLDYHQTMEAYGESKRRLFTEGKPRWAVFNGDDPTAYRFFVQHEGPKVLYGMDNPEAMVVPRKLELKSDGISLDLYLPRREGEAALGTGDTCQINSPLRGRFNASNLMGAAALGVALGLAPEQIGAALTGALGAPGRFEALREGQDCAVYVDYAHTPDAVERVLENVRAITAGKVYVVLGCGGDRDAGKRPIMGNAIGRLADFSVITTDNSRSEDPGEIAAAMEKGLLETRGKKAYRICLDRREAIQWAINQAGRGDAVLIAGKGHEDYQIIGAERFHFDDREEARKACREKMGGQ